MADSDIELNPGVLDGNQGEQVPLSDLYGMPVFSPDIEQQIKAAQKEQEKELTEIRDQIFDTHTTQDVKDMTEIRAQLFTIDSPLTKTGAASRAYGNGGQGMLVALEAMVLAFLIILFFYQKHRQKKRREIQDEAYDYGE
ncbi:MAG TPA: type VII secretion EssA family protein [Candidatus Mediterraneibacter intestinipullorum]|nr:type VII secretion EssA family protein [Candidatus Mediterraneibacter intestinipullorum]